MDKFAFLFCIHNCQPVGNFLHILENAYAKAYLPLIEVLKKYPFMKIFIQDESCPEDGQTLQSLAFSDRGRSPLREGIREDFSKFVPAPLLAVGFRA
jgi:hypothetical protein